MTIPQESTEQVRWLVDRALVQDVLVRHARALDTRDFEGLAGLFAEDGVIVMQGNAIGKADIPAFSVQFLGLFEATQHFTANLLIDLDGDRASATSYFQAAHVPDAERDFEHTDVAGLYKWELRRDAGCWLIVRQDQEFVWSLGKSMGSYFGAPDA